MGRLIDVDYFTKQEVLEQLRTAEFDDEIIDVVNQVPTIFDELPPHACDFSRELGGRT